MFSVCQNCYKWIGLGWSRWCKKAQMVQRSWLGRRLLQVLSSLMPHHLVDNKHLITAQKIETAAGAKVEIRGRHVQLWRLPWGRPEQSSRCEWKGAEDLWWLLITSSTQRPKKTLCVRRNVLSVETRRSSKNEDMGSLHKCYFHLAHFFSADIFFQLQQMYFYKLCKHISECSAGIFLQGFLCVICAPQLKNLKYEQYETLNKWHQFSLQS